MPFDSAVTGARKNSRRIVAALFDTLSKRGERAAGKSPGPRSEARSEADSGLYHELYGIGVGPGESGLITLRAASILARVDVIFVPAPKDSRVSLAGEIAARSGARREVFRTLSFPMARETQTLERAWAGAAREVCDCLDKKKKAAFITLGDPSIYSTWNYLREAVLRLRPATRIETLPGIPAFAAAAARMGISIVEQSESFCLLPLPDPVDGLDSYAALTDTIAVYKIGARLPELARWARERGLENSAWFVEGVGLEREKSGLLREVPDSEPGYLSVVIIKKPRSHDPA